MPRLGGALRSRCLLAYGFPTARSKIRIRFVLFKRTIAVNIEHAEGLLEIGDLILTESVLGHDVGVS